MQLKPITAIVVLLLVVASLLVAGCTSNKSPSSSTSTPTPIPAQADYSSFFDWSYRAGGFFLDTPFTKSTNVRGNDVYMGSIRNTSLPGQKGVTVVEELTNSQTEAKQLYDKYVSNKLSEGYTSYPQEVANWKYDGKWFGATDPTHQFYVLYRYSTDVNSWVVTTQASN